MILKQNLISFIKNLCSTFPAERKLLCVCRTEDSGVIYKANKEDGSGKEIVKGNLTRYLRDIKVYSKSKQTGENNNYLCA